jgi:ectoine hydroxylase-related dioxygenase (phytanoyl-CoA dioxygenase family)
MLSWLRTLSPKEALAARVRRGLSEDGFSIIDFPDPELCARAAEIKKFMDRHLDWQAWTDGLTHDMRCADAWEIDEDIRAIATNEVVRGLLSSVYGRQAFPFQTLNFMAGSQQSAHVDIVHFSGKPHDCMAGVWLALEDIDEAAGPLFYYPGSHKWPVLTPESLGIPTASPSNPYEHYGMMEEAWAAQRERHSAKIAYFTPKAGQALIWHANLMHGGAKHLDKSKSRLSQVTHYFFEGTGHYTPLTGQDRLPTRIA